jgi:hypothetical protein
VAENRGSGISMMISRVRRNTGLVPLFAASLDYFCVTIPRASAVTPELRAWAVRLSRGENLSEAQISAWRVEHAHWLRDVIWKEDKSLIRTGNAPPVWSALTNLVITLFRIHGVTSYTAETRHCAQDPRHALQFLDLTGLSPG